jgi:hypothetical protein
MPGLFRNSIQAMSEDLKKINETISESLDEMVAGMKKLLRNKED